MKLSAALVAIVSCVPAVLGHGYVSKMVIGGKTYTGRNPFERNSKLATPIRQISSTNPITNANSNDMICGIGATASSASVVAEATPGSTLQFWWNENKSSPWGHTAGPILTYMAKCPSSGCKGWDAKGATWYKISQAGRRDGSTVWVQADLHAGKPYSTKIPTGIPSGEYMVRHEVIALHQAQSTNGAQFYPSCSQVKITGGASGSTLRSANGAPSASFPGAYKASDPGLKINIYSLKASQTYKYPGPNVATFSGSGGGDSGNTDPTTTANSAKPSSTKASNPQTTKKGSNHVATTTTGGAPPAQTTKPSSGGGGGGSCKNKRSRRSASARFAGTARSSSSMKRREAEENKVHWRVARGRAMSSEVEALELYRRAHQKRAEEIESEFYED